MKKFVGIFALLVLLVITFAMTFTVSAADGDYYIYTAEELNGIGEVSGLGYKFVRKDDSTFLSFSLNSATNTAAYVRFNFYPSTASEADYVPEFKAKDYPIVVVSCKTNITKSWAVLAANAGLKIKDTGKYQRCWALNSSTTFASTTTKDKLVKVVFDISSFRGFEGGDADWSGVDDNSGLKYFRIPPWNNTGSTTADNYTSEYFDVEYIGAFKTVADDNAFDYSKYRGDNVLTVTFKDEDGSVINEVKTQIGYNVSVPAHKNKDGYVFAGWKDIETGVIHNGGVTVSDNMTLVAEYAEYILLDGEELSFGAGGTGFDVSKYVVDENGLSTVRYTVPETGGTYNSAVQNGVINIKNDVLVKEYPIVAIGYKSNISNPKNWAVSIALKTSSNSAKESLRGKYSRFWGLTADQINDSGYHKAVVNLNNITGGDAGVDFKDVDSDSTTTYIRFTPWGTATGTAMIPGDWFEITFVAFFKDEVAAKAFVYTPDVFDADGDVYHQAFMTVDDDFAFRPDDKLTRAELLSAISRLIIDYDIIEGEYVSSYTDVDFDAWYYDDIAYLERRAYISGNGKLNPDEYVTKGEIAELLELVTEKEGIDCEYTGYTASATITRIEAAELFCNLFDRTPTVDGTKYKTTGYFKDVPKSAEKHLYAVEATYTHASEIENGKEDWVWVEDTNFYIEKADQSLIDELNSTFERRKAEVLATESDYHEGTGTVFYVSNSGNDANNGTSPQTPLATLARVMELQDNGTIKAGDVVLLERGGEWHQKFKTKIGVTYSAYGTGEKPRVIGATEADNASQWIPVNGYPGLYKFETPFGLDRDVGNIVFNNGEMYGQRVIRRLYSNEIIEAGRDMLVGNGRDFWELDVSKYEFADYTDILDIVAEEKKNGNNPDLIFFHYWTEYEGGDGYLYLYCEDGNPGDVFDSVEICTHGHAVAASSNVVIDNWAVLYNGSHGIQTGSCSNLTVRNCEIGWIGGSVQYLRYELGIPVRYGNGVEIYGTCDGYYVYNNYFQNCFDCGPTVQFSTSLSEGQKLVMKDVAIYDNVCWDGDLEVWFGSDKPNTETTYAKIINCRLYNNLVRGSGYGFGAYNHQNNEYTSFYGGGTTCTEHIETYIENNYFWDLRYSILRAGPVSIYDNKGYFWRNNTTINTYNNSLGQLAENTREVTGSLYFYDYTNERLKYFLADGVFEYNRFMYILADGQTDSYPIHLENVAKYEKKAWTEISDAYELAQMQADGKYKLVADVDLDGWLWQPVGTEAVPFTGEFDGNGYEIRNFTSDTDKDVSLFGVCSGADIKNLVISNSKIKVEGEDDVYVSLIAHKSDNRTRITDCSVSGEIEVTVSGDAYVAGICAYNDGAVISGCSSNATVNAVSDGAVYAAGVCAFVYSDGKLDYCYNSGTITGEGESDAVGAVFADSAESTENALLVPEIDHCYDLTASAIGDIDGDGKIVPMDALVFARYLAEWTEAEESVKPENSDINNDGRINSLDAVALIRHIAGWNGYGSLPVIFE